MSSVQPSYDDPTAKSVHARSVCRWRAALRVASADSSSPHTNTNLQGILSRIPALPDIIPQSVTWIDGQSTWVNSDASCSLKTKEERVQRISLTKMRRTYCTISPSHNFRAWPGKVNNGVALLVLGWAYILSASLAERRGLSMEYTKPTTLSSGSTKIDLDFASSHELAWWKALVGQGIGWSVEGGTITPWAVTVDTLAVEIAGEVHGSQRAPTAKQAAHYLGRVCDAFELGDQTTAALAAALTIPLHASTRPWGPVTIELPALSMTSRVASPNHSTLPSDFRYIDYYMTLSLCPWALGPALWSIFWEPDVPCNYAGAWIGPIAAFLEPIINDNDMELLAKVLSFTKIGPLWLGVTLCGRGAIVKSILPYLTELRDYPFTRPDIDAAAWTGISQSFIDERRSRFFCEEKISRADVWRLRHDRYTEYSNNGFLYTPPYGWPPFGEMRAEDVELEIRSHLRCSHDWQYTHWSWLPSHSTDAGYSKTNQHTSLAQEDSRLNGSMTQASFMETHILHDVSETATKAAFWWCCEQVEKGFGGALVPRRHGPDEILNSAESDSSVDTELVHQWLHALEEGHFVNAG